MLQSEEKEKVLSQCEPNKKKNSVNLVRRLSLAVRYTKEIEIGFSVRRGLLNATTNESCCIQNKWRSQISSHKFLKRDIIIYGVGLKLGIVLRSSYCNWFYNCGLIQS